MPPDDRLRLVFRADGNAASCRAAGWSEPEAEETWCLGARSTLLLPAPRAAVPHVLMLDARPHVQPGHLPAQRLLVDANGVRVGAFTLSERALRACVIPADAVRADRPLEIVFTTPDAARPSDFGQNDSRKLALAFATLQLYPDRPAPDAAAPDLDAARLPVSELMLHFESLGQNCEFGLVQRRCAAEPLGLLRFASTPLPNLLAALDAGFAGMGMPQSVQAEISGNGREFMVTDERYGITYHAWVQAGEMTAEALRQREARRVPMLVRKLLQELQLGEKIFVFKGMGPLPEEAVFPLAALLRRHGPNTLLFVSLADADHQAGTVAWRAPGFMVGYLDRFAPGEDAYDFQLDPWVRLCREAIRVRSAGP